MERIATMRTFAGCSIAAVKMRFSRRRLLGCDRKQV